VVVQRDCDDQDDEIDVLPVGVCRANEAVIEYDELIEAIV
jgi:hypothetical protein